MNADDFKALCVAPTCTLLDALARLDATARGILMVLAPDGTLARRSSKAISLHWKAPVNEWNWALKPAML